MYLGLSSGLCLALKDVSEQLVVQGSYSANAPLRAQSVVQCSGACILQHKGLLVLSQLLLRIG